MVVREAGPTGNADSLPGAEIAIPEKV